MDLGDCGGGGSGAGYTTEGCIFGKAEALGKEYYGQGTAKTWI